MYKFIFFCNIVFKKNVFFVVVDVFSLYVNFVMLCKLCERGIFMCKCIYVIKSIK